MSLYLIESWLPPDRERATLFRRIDEAASAAEGALIELRVGVDVDWLYTIVEHDSPKPLEPAAWRHLVVAVASIGLALPMRACVADGR